MWLTPPQIGQIVMFNPESDNYRYQIEQTEHLDSVIINLSTSYDGELIYSTLRESSGRNVFIQVRNGAVIECNYRDLLPIHGKYVNITKHAEEEMTTLRGQLRYEQNIISGKEQRRIIKYDSEYRKQQQHRFIEILEKTTESSSRYKQAREVESEILYLLNAEEGIIEADDFFSIANERLIEEKQRTRQNLEEAMARSERGEDPLDIAGTNPAREILVNYIDVDDLPRPDARDARDLF